MKGRWAGVTGELFVITPGLWLLMVIPKPNEGEVFSLRVDSPLRTWPMVGPGLDVLLRKES